MKVPLLNGLGAFKRLATSMGRELDMVGGGAAVNGCPFETS